jgi:hypothetical protein
MDPITETQADVGAFDGGKSYIGTEWADWVEDRGRDVVTGLQAASQDQEGWHDDALRGIGTSAKWLNRKWQEGTADQEGIGDDILRSIGGGAKNTRRALDAASYYGGKAGGAIAKSVGVDPRIGGAIGNVVGEAVTGFGAKKALQIGKYVKRGDAFDDLVRAAAPEGSTYRMMLDTGGGVVSPKRTSKAAVKTKKVREVITKNTLESDAYKKWRTEGAKYYKDNFDKHAPMRGYPWFTDPETGLKYSLSTGDKTGEIINNKAVRNLTNISRARRNVRDAKRFATTEITVDRAHEIANKFKQPPEAAEAFLKFQQEYKKHILKRIENINKRIKKNPNAYGKDTKASLGHLRAAERYIEGADMASNIDIEDFIQNITRSNLDEVSDQFNRGLGRSLDLEEEFLKFIDKDLGTYHGASGLRLGRHQSETAIKYVRKQMDDDIDWKSWLTDKGKQLFESKEDFLVNEAIEKFRGDKMRNLQKTLVDVRSNGFGKH